MMHPTLDALESAERLIRQVMPPTPQIRWPLLCERIGTDVWVKHENHTPVGAFKIRGGIVYLEELKRRKPGASGVIAATRGNHGQSIAFAAARLGLRSVIVVPRGNSREKNRAMRALGAKLIEHGRDFQESFEYARQLAETEQLEFVPSIHEGLVCGVATCAMELFREVPALDALYVPIGMGSGVCGAVAARNALGLKTEIVGVTILNAPAYAQSFAQRRPIPAEVAPTIADGMACRVPDAEALEVMYAGISRLITVDEPDIRDAMRTLFTDTHNVAEGAGAAALAGLSKDPERTRYRRVAVVQTGGNVDTEVFAAVLAGTV